MMLLSFILAFSDPKGGVGKTTAAMNTAIELHDRGYRVAFADGEDEPANGEDLRTVEPDIGLFNPRTVTEMQSVAEAMRTDYDVGILDMAGETSQMLVSVCMFADFIFVPLQPNKKDFKQAFSFLKLLRVNQVQRGGKPEAAIFFTFCAENSLRGKEYRDLLAPIEIPIAKTIIRRLEVYAKHDTVMRDTKHNTKGAATDIRSLLAEFLDVRLPPLNSRAANE